MWFFICMQFRHLLDVKGKGTASNVLLEPTKFVQTEKFKDHAAIHSGSTKGWMGYPQRKKIVDGQNSKPSLVPNISFNFKDALCQNVYTIHGLQGGFSVCYMQCACVI